MKKLLTPVFFVLMATLWCNPLHAQNHVPANWAECVEMITGEWQMVRIDRTGMQPEMIDKNSQRDKLIFYKDSRVLMLKDNNSGSGKWKYDPKSATLVFADTETGDVTEFTLINLTKDELIIRYEPYLEKSTLMYYIPL